MGNFKSGNISETCLSEISGLLDALYKIIQLIKYYIRSYGTKLRAFV